jgi:hypothetical protein
MRADPVELRAERLRLFIAAIGEEPSMRLHEGGFVPGGWTYYIGEQSPLDFAEEFNLAWACAELAQELRDRQWQALEQFGEAHAAGEQLAAAIAAFDLGWHHRLS